MFRLQVRPRGLFPDISFGREPSNSTGGTSTHVAAGFPGAHLKPESWELGLLASSVGFGVFGHGDEDGN